MRENRQFLCITLELSYIIKKTVENAQILHGAMIKYFILFLLSNFLQRRLRDSFSKSFIYPNTKAVRRLFLSRLTIKKGKRKLEEKLLTIYKEIFLEDEMGCVYSEKNKISSSTCYEVVCEPC